MKLADQVENIKNQLTKHPYGYTLDSMVDITSDLPSVNGVLKCFVETQNATPCFVWIDESTMKVLDCKPIW